MAPPVLNLETLKNTFRDGVFFGSYTDDTFTSTSDVDLFAVRKEDYSKILFQLKNISGGLPVDFLFYGNADSDIVESGTNLSRLDPPDYSTEDYTLLNNGEFSVESDESASRIITDNWTWILVRAKLFIGGTVEFTISVRGE